MLADHSRGCFMRRYWIEANQNGAVFDRGRAMLLLFEHVHAGLRSRRAMVDLLSRYETVGLQLNCANYRITCRSIWVLKRVAGNGDMRDYEYCYSVALLGGRLKQRGAPWYQLFDALLTLAGSTLTSDSVTSKLFRNRGMIPVRHWMPSGKKSR